MFVNLETERMLLKCVDQSDREFIFEEFQNNFINKYLFDEEPMTEIEQADGLIDFYNMMEPRNQNRWVLLDKLNNKKMGTCGFHLWDQENNKVEIGFELLEEYNGNGYMTEAVEAFIEFARIKMNVTKIVAKVYFENINCKKLLAKFGFKLVGNEECLFRGSMYLHNIYELELLKG